MGLLDKIKEQAHNLEEHKGDLEKVAEQVKEHLPGHHDKPADGKSANKAE